MPRVRWGHALGAEGRAYPRRVIRFLEPCLLQLLREDASHGYDLLDALGQFGFAPGTLDTSVVYRQLRDMENSGWVTSQWDTEGSGPPRRVYTVTAQGEQHLAVWINDLRRTRDELDQFLTLYDTK